MSDLLMLEKFKGEKDGEHYSVYVATDTKLNRYMSFNLELKQVGDQVVNDVRNTLSADLRDDKYKMFKEHLHCCVSSQNYLSDMSTNTIPIETEEFLIKFKQTIDFVKKRTSYSISNGKATNNRDSKKHAKSTPLNKKSSYILW